MKFKRQKAWHEMIILVSLNFADLINFTDVNNASLILSL